VGSVDILAGCLLFLFIMHPSSFYDLQAHYVYTPLYGLYSLSEALEGLDFYPLEESQDSISIGSNRTLRHELVLELSNVVDDLQDYLVYFSSKFLIFPLNSPDLIKKLQASCDGFEHLSVCWGAIITCLIITHKIVEDYFGHISFNQQSKNSQLYEGSNNPPHLSYLMQHRTNCLHLHPHSLRHPKLMVLLTQQTPQWRRNTYRHSTYKVKHHHQRPIPQLAKKTAHRLRAST